MITGAGGQLGRCLAEAAEQLPNCEVFSFGRSDLDISQEEALLEIFSEIQPTLCFNCAAYTAVDKAEEEEEAAMRANYSAVGLLARVCRLYTTALVHFSTDYVYADHYNRPLREGDETVGSGVYARSKLLGENAILAAYPDALIIRTSWVYSEYGHNFMKTMLRLGQERPQLQVVSDQVGTPTYARDLAAAALALAKHGEGVSGIYNFSNSGVCSWYDFAMAVQQLAGTACTLLPVRTSAYPTAARRPHYSVLDKEKVSAVLGAPPRHWRLALEDALARLSALSEAGAF